MSSLVTLTVERLEDFLFFLHTQEERRNSRYVGLRWALLQEHLRTCVHEFDRRLEYTQFSLRYMLHTQRLCVCCVWCCVCTCVCVCCVCVCVCVCCTG